MRYPVAWFLACHTSGWIKCLEHMKERFPQRLSKASSAAVATWRQIVRSQAFVGLFLAVLIVLLAWPRLTGPSWTTFQMPFDLRESEGNTVQWEQIHHFNALHATLRSDAGWVIEGRYSTDHYRGLLPIYVSAVFAYWLDSSYKGFALVDLLGWWVAAWALYYLARRLDTDHMSALTAAVLLAASPLLISHMWRNAVHVVHSASLVPCFLVALLLLTDKRLAHGWRVTGLASVLYIASLTYQYQWIIVPCLLSLAVVERQRWIWSLSIITAAILFIGMIFLTYQLLGSVGLSVSSHLNDPLAVVSSRLTLAVGGDVPMPMRTFVVEKKLLALVELLIKAYHPFVVLLSVIGLIFAPTRLRILVCAGAALGLATGYLHPWSWVAMNGYPFLYIGAGLALVQGPRWLADTVAHISSRRYPQSAARIASGSGVLARFSTVVLLLLAMWSTNGDLFGNYNFAQEWWDYTYFLR